MIKVIKGKASLLLLIILVSICPVSLASPHVEKVPVIVVFKDKPNPALIKAHNGDIRYQYNIIPGIACSLPARAIEALQHNPNVLYIEENILFTASTEYDLSWGVDRIDADQVHSTNKGAGVKIAILDTGIDYTHSELSVNYFGGTDFVNHDSDPMDDGDHGTHCAGIIGAEDNGAGVIGVAPDAELYAVKVLDENGSGYLSDVILGIEWAVDHNMQVISMSLGSDSYVSALETACDNAEASGLVLVAAAGNDYQRRGKKEMDTIDYPARFESVIAVGATTQSDDRASFSSTGSTIELAAPGYQIYSTVIGGYDIKSGTSMACPHVAGVAALVLASPVDSNYDNGNGVWDPDEVRAKLRSTADDLGSPGWDNWYGYGLVDAEEACQGSEDTTPPSVTEMTPEPGSTITNDSPLISAKVTDSSGIDASSIVLKVNGDVIVHQFDGTDVTYQLTGLSDGLHTIYLEVMDTEGNLAQASWSFTVDTTPVSGELTADLAMTAGMVKRAGKNTFVKAETTITVTGNGPMEGATVYGHWVYPSSEPLTGTTNSLGQVIFESPQVKVDSNGYVFEFMLDDIQKTGWTYTGPQTVTYSYPP